jgi:DnaJ-class molecular chaperone
MRQQVSTELYRHLGLEDYASISAIKKAYRKLCLKYHPDRNPGNEKRMAEINQAYDFLVRHKGRYDELLKMHRQRSRVRVVVEETRGTFYPNWSASWTSASFPDPF